jgi:ferrous-iron efflux pump FieF
MLQTKQPEVSTLTQTIKSTDYQLWVKRSGYLTLSIALTILLLKFSAVLATNSSSVLASFTDASMDLLVSVLNFAVLRYALRPADHNHGFGHGKAEAVMALLQAAFLTGAALLLLTQTFSRLNQTEAIQQLAFGMWITVLCAALTLTLVLAQRWIIKRTGSLAVKADLLHYRSDLLMNLLVLIALFLASQNLLWVDNLVAVLICGYLLYSAFELAKEALQHLLDEQLPAEQLERIEQTLLTQAEVLAVEQLKTRQAGPYVFIQLRLVLQDDLSLLAAHAIVDKAELQLTALYKQAEVIIHAEPYSESELKQKIQSPS